MEWVDARGIFVAIGRICEDQISMPLNRSILGPWSVRKSANAWWRTRCEDEVYEIHQITNVVMPVAIWIT